MEKEQGTQYSVTLTTRPNKKKQQTSYTSPMGDDGFKKAAGARRIKLFSARKVCLPYLTC